MQFAFVVSFYLINVKSIVKTIFFKLKIAHLALKEGFVYLHVSFLIMDTDVSKSACVQSKDAMVLQGVVLNMSVSF